MLVLWRIRLRRWQSLRFLKGNPKLRFLLPFRSDLGVDLRDVVAALGDGLRPAFESCVDLRNFGVGILERVDPVPLGWQPVATQIFRMFGLKVADRQRARQNGHIHPAFPNATAQLPDHNRVLPSTDAPPKLEQSHAGV